MMFSAMWIDAFDDSTNVIKFKYDLDGKHFNTRWFMAKKKVLEDMMLDFLFADDCALIGRTAEEYARQPGQIFHLLQ